LVETSTMAGSVMIRPVGSIRDISLIPCILQVFADYLKQGQYSFVLDLGKMEFLTPAMIALLFEVTARARRNGGNVEIVNLNESSRKSLAHFSPSDYLLINDNFKLSVEQNFARERRANEATIPSLADSTLQEKDIGPKPRKSSEIRIPSRAESIYKACNFVTSLAAQAGISSLELGKFKIAVYEACLNAIEHAYRSDPNQSIIVRVEYDEFKFTTTVIDTGEGFTDTEAAFYDVVEAASERQTGGMGLHIIRKTMDQVSYESDPFEGNRLIMTKIIGQPESDRIHKQNIHQNR